MRRTLGPSDEQQNPAKVAAPARREGPVLALDRMDND